jgi:large subunit ribosomal protein L24
MPENQRTKKVVEMNLPLKFSDVRLVVRSEGEQQKEDVIIRHLRGGAPHVDRGYGSNIPRHTRYVAGSVDGVEDLEIPWPDAEVQDFEMNPVDTARFDVEQITWLPSVLEAPLPKGVEDELILKRSRMRARHNDEWVAKKIVEDARSLWYEQRGMVVPRMKVGDMLPEQVRLMNGEEQVGKPGGWRDPNTAEEEARMHRMRRIVGQFRAKEKREQEAEREKLVH